MTVFETGYDLAAPDYIENAEQLLQALARAAHPISRATLQGKPVYIVADVALAKQIFEDAKNFSFAPIGLSGEQGLTEGAKAFVEEGFESRLVSADYDDYRRLRALMNNAFKCSYADRAASVDAAATRHLEKLLAAFDETPSTITTDTLIKIDVLALCRRFWLPLIADIIGVSSLTDDELVLLAQQARALNDGYGLHSDPAAVKELAALKATVLGLIGKVVAAKAAPAYSALGYFLSQADVETATDLALTFILGSIDGSSGVLALQTHLLAQHPEQRARFLALSEAERQVSMTELAAKEAPVYYMPRFAVRDVNLLGVEIPAGSCLQLALHGMNSCANPDFDIAREQRGGCPRHNNETIPFGHARHKCPGETLSRHLIPIFLHGFFTRFDVVAIDSFHKNINSFSRTVSEFAVSVRDHRYQV